MWGLVLFVIILFVGLKFSNKINGMHNNLTAEELQTYQETVFVHIDEEIAEYERQIDLTYTETMDPLLEQIECAKKELKELIEEYKGIEKRLDEKIIKFNNYSKLIK